MKEDLLSSDLFGNEAGEDEELDVLHSYFVSKPEFQYFNSERSKFQIVRSRKGVGKSTLLREVYYLKEQEENSICIYVKGADLVALRENTDVSPNALIFVWQQRLCSRITLEIGKSIKLAMNDDTVSMVEAAELAGYRGRNLVSCLVDRLKVKFPKTPTIEKTSLEIQNSKELLGRFSQKNDFKVWLFIDDIDATFVNTEEERIKLSTFFSACRDLMNQVDGLIIRASVRTDVWTILKQYDEALDKCEQYMFELSWSTLETGQILLRKILSYFRRTYPLAPELQHLQIEKDADEIYRMVFTKRILWGIKAVPPHKPVHLLSNGRPRWAAQLCKLAAKDAAYKDKNVISIKNIAGVLRDFGRSRLDDVYREHRHQCGELKVLLEAFAGGARIYSTQALLKKIKTDIIKKIGPPVIEGREDTGEGLDTAHFLFRIDFIQGRNEKDITGLAFVKYEDRPNLLTTSVNYDDGLDWEIHPRFHEVLSLVGK